MAVERSRSEDNSQLLELVQLDVSTLSPLWLAVLQDYALLTLGQEEASGLSAAGKLLLRISSPACEPHCSSSPRSVFLHSRDGRSGQSSLLLRLGSHPARHRPVAPWQRSVLLLLFFALRFDGLFVFCRFCSVR